jgi:hypothetical protein
MAADRGPAAPSEAEVQMMLAQMREAPAEQILVEVVNILLQAAQVKLGRPDARLLLDTVAAVAAATSGRADDALVSQVEQAIAQLRLAQVEEEARLTPGAPQGSAQAEKPGSETSPGPAGPGTGRPAAASTPPATDARPAPGGSRLWVPGR